MWATYSKRRLQTSGSSSYLLGRELQALGPGLVAGGQRERPGACPRDLPGCLDFAFLIEICPQR